MAPGRAGRICLVLVLLGVAAARGRAAAASPSESHPRASAAADRGPGTSSASEGLAPNAPLSLKPPIVSFAPAMLYTRADAQVEVGNEDASRSIEVLRVHSSNRNFQVRALSEPFALAPLARLHLRVMFHPLEVGEHTNRVVIESSAGNVTLVARGMCAGNGYKLPNTTNLLVPINTKLTVNVSLTNPHAEGRDLLVESVFSRESVFHVAQMRPPADASRGIAPGATRRVFMLEFLQSTPATYSGFVHMITNVDTIALPVEVRVVPHPLVGDPPLLQMGQLLVCESRSFGLRVRNLLAEPQPVVSVRLVEPDALLAELVDVLPVASGSAPLVVGGEARAVVAELRLNVLSSATVSKLCAEGCRVREVRGLVRVNELVEIEFRVSLVPGMLEIEQPETMLFPLRTADSSLLTLSSRKDADGFVLEEIRALRLVNRFAVPLRLRGASLTHQSADERATASVFALESVPKKLIIPPDEAVTIGRVRFTPPAKRGTWEATVALRTNATEFFFPLVAYDGLLSLRESSKQQRYQHVSWISADASLRESFSNGTEVALSAYISGRDGSLRFEAVPVGVSQTFTLEVVNPNPVPVTLKSVRSVLPVVQFALGGPGAEFMRVRDTPARVPPLGALALSVRVTPLRSGKSYGGFVDLTTENGQEINVGVDFEGLVGALAVEPSNLVFPATFPGAPRIELALFATHSFDRDVGLVAVRSSDSRFLVETRASVLSKAARGERVLIAVVTFDSLVADDSGGNYMAGRLPECRLQRRSCGSADWALMDADVAAERALLAASRRGAELFSKMQHDVSANLEIHTSLASLPPVPLSARLFDPSVISNCTLNFRLVGVNSTKSMFCRLRNPSPFPVVVAPLLLLQELEAEAADGAFRWGPDAIEEAVVLEPHANGHIGPVAFSPRRSGFFEGRLYLKSNLSGVEPLLLTGRGGQGRLALGAQAIAIDASLERLGLEVREDGFFTRSGVPVASEAALSDAVAMRPLDAFLEVRNAGEIALLLESVQLLPSSPSEDAPVNVCEQRHRGLLLHGCAKPGVVLEPGAVARLRVELAVNISSLLRNATLRVVSSWGTETVALRVAAAADFLELVARFAPLSRGMALLRLVTAAAVVLGVSGWAALNIRQCRHKKRNEVPGGCDSLRRERVPHVVAQAGDIKAPKLKEGAEEPDGIEGEGGEDHAAPPFFDAVESESADNGGGVASQSVHSPHSEVELALAELEPQRSRPTAGRLRRRKRDDNLPRPSSLSASVPLSPLQPLSEPADGPQGQRRAPPPSSQEQQHERQELLQQQEQRKQQQQPSSSQVRAKPSQESGPDSASEGEVSPPAASPPQLERPMSEPREGQVPKAQRARKRKKSTSEHQQIAAQTQSASQSDSSSKGGGGTPTGADGQKEKRAPAPPLSRNHSRGSTGSLHLEASAPSVRIDAAKSLAARSRSPPPPPPPPPASSPQQRQRRSSQQQQQQQQQQQRASKQRPTVAQNAQAAPSVAAPPAAQARSAWKMDRLSASSLSSIDTAAKAASAAPSARPAPQGAAVDTDVAGDGALTAAKVAAPRANSPPLLSSLVRAGSPPGSGSNMGALAGFTPPPLLLPQLASPLLGALPAPVVGGIHSPPTGFVHAQPFAAPPLAFASASAVAQVVASPSAPRVSAPFGAHGGGRPFAEPLAEDTEAMRPRSRLPSLSGGEEEGKFFLPRLLDDDDEDVNAEDVGVAAGNENAGLDSGANVHGPDAAVLRAAGLGRSEAEVEDMAMDASQGAQLPAADMWSYHYAFAGGADSHPLGAARPNPHAEAPTGQNAAGPRRV